MNEYIIGIAIIAGVYLLYRYFKRDKGASTALSSAKLKSDTKPIKQKKHFDILFLYLPSCGHCTKMKKNIDKLSSTYNIKKVQLDKSLADKYSVYAVPTLVKTKNNRIVDKYQGDRSLKSIERFCKDKL